MIPVITNEPPYISATSIPVRIANQSAVPITGNTNSTIINTEPIPITGTTTIEGDEEHPFPTKIISDEDHPVLVDVVNETFNAYVNNPSPIDVNVVNQLELPQSYPISYTSPLNVNEIKPYNENSLIFVTSYLFYQMDSASSTSLTVNIKSPITINIENYNEWYFEIKDIIVNNMTKNAMLSINTVQSNLNPDNFIKVNTLNNNIPRYIPNTYGFKSGKINYKGNFNNGDTICQIIIGKGSYDYVAEVTFEVNFYCRAKAYYTYLNN